MQNTATSIEVKVENNINALIIQSKLPKTTSEMLRVSFNNFFDEAEKWEAKAAVINITDISQDREMRMAKEIRLAVRDIRLSADKTRKELKEESNRYNKAVQGIYTVIEAVTTGIEAKMLRHEKFKEDEEARQRAELLSSRDQLLSPYRQFLPAITGLSTMDEKDFQQYLELGKAAMETARLQAEKDKKEAEAQAKILKDKERKDEMERAKLQKEKEKAEAKAKSEKEKREKSEAESKAKLEKERQASDKKKLQIVRQKEAAQAKALKLKQELDARKKAEAKKVADAKAAEAKAQRAPDKEKILNYVHDLGNLNLPTMKTKEANTIRDFIVSKINDLQKSITIAAKEL